LARFPRDGNQIANETFSPHDLKLKEIAVKHLGSAVLVTVGLLAVGATTGPAAVVCNGEGDCWRTKERYTYPPDAGVRVYSDDWKWGPTKSIDGESMRAADTGAPKVLGSSFRELSFP